MWFHNPRIQLLYALLLDWLGQLFILLGILALPSLHGSQYSNYLNLDGQWNWLTFCFLLFPLLGWLFGSYTVLRWPRLALPVLLQRVLITGIVTLLVVALARWIVNPNDTIWLVSRRVQFVWFGVLAVWSLFVRLALRKGLLSPDPPRLLVLASYEEMPAILRAWARVSPNQRLSPISPVVLQHLLDDCAAPLLVILSSSQRRDPTLFALIERLEKQDPRFVKTISVTEFKHTEKPRGL